MKEEWTGEPMKPRKKCYTVQLIRPLYDEETPDLVAADEKSDTLVKSMYW